MIGQTADVAPADKTLYALRDVTGTVESIPLITASILSKKLAEGISGLVMDVKCGHGAFMKTRDDARRLADSLVRVGTANGLKTTAIITAMDAPLGRYVGNSLEVIESIETLKGNGPRDLTDLSVLLAARMVKARRACGRRRGSRPQGSRRHWIRGPGWRSSASASSSRAATRGSSTTTRGCRPHRERWKSSHCGADT